MRSVQRVLLKQMRLQQATEAGDVDFRIVQVVTERVPNWRTNHGENTTAVHFQLNQVGVGWLNKGDLDDWRAQLDGLSGAWPKRHSHTPELSVGRFSSTQPNPTHQITDLKPNP